jgi:hypothetical protein
MLELLDWYDLQRLARALPLSTLPYHFITYQLSNMTHRPRALLIFQQQHCSHPTWHLATLAAALLSSSHTHFPPSYVIMPSSIQSPTTQCHRSASMQQICNYFRPDRLSIIGVDRLFKARISIRFWYCPIEESLEQIPNFGPKSIARLWTEIIANKGQNFPHFPPPANGRTDTRRFIYRILYFLIFLYFQFSYIFSDKLHLCMSLYLLIGS